ncbi:MAG: HAMP domain-containing sensor histidine kinase [Oscillospiraceae bacterium]|nr:HAMP domain-containing sensor histidine kinase [Oscillospiraceae bacterium]
MKAFNRIFAAVIAAVLLLFAVANGILLRDKADNDRPYLVEVNRLSRKIQTDTFEPSDLTACDYVTAVSGYSENFYNSPSDYVVREINGELYRFDYHTDRSAEKAKQMLIVNAILAGMSVLIVSVLFYTKRNILAPFNQLKDVPYALSKGNLTVPMKESKSRFFGNFLWGLDLLRENLEQQKERELELQRDRKMLLLSLSHDIKTPLSAIKLYAKALSRGLYTDKEKQLEVAESIHAKANEIEHYVTQIVTASREDFLTFDVTMGEFYLSELVEKIRIYYTEKLSLIKTDFSLEEYPNFLVRGDLDRSIEVIQNIMENAIKYGDGQKISIHFSEEEGCLLFTVRNSGCSLPDTDLPHMFDSFWRGANAETQKGSGLGLYICRQLMRKMNGEAFAEIQNGDMCVTALFEKA